MHYKLKGKHAVCFNAKIGLTGSVVNSKAENLNSGSRSQKSFRLSCQVQRLEVSVAYVVDRILHCTVQYILII